jgi:malate dehydrogenase
MVAIISNPVNSTVPIFVEQMRKRGFDPRRVFGVTTLDLVRANTFVSEAAGISVDDIHVPVIGGHAGASILPVISQTTPPVEFDQATIEALTHRIQNGGTEVVKAKAGAGSATLSMAKAGAQFAANLIKANNGEEGIIEYAYIESDSTESAYFSTPLKLGRDGTFENLGLPELNDYEQKLLVDAIKELEGSIKDGVEFVVSGVIPE